MARPGPGRQNPPPHELTLAVQGMTEGQQLAAAALLNQEELADALLELTPSQNLFLRMRLMSTNETQARHMAGHPAVSTERGKRGRKLTATSKCQCSLQVVGWQDVRDETVRGWKSEPRFRRVYDTMLHAPVLFSSTRLEQLSSVATAVYERALLDMDVPWSIKIRAAADIVKMNGLMGGDDGTPAQNTLTSSVMFQLALERLKRGMELNNQQRQLLIAGGVDPNSAPVEMTRTLDGDDELIEGTFAERPAAQRGDAEGPQPPEESAESAQVREAAALRDDVERGDLESLDGPSTAAAAWLLDQGITEESADRGATTAAPDPEVSENVLAALPDWMRG